MPLRPGLVALFGSGETSASGRRIDDWLLRRLAPPIRIAVLETPAGFQPNSEIVAGKVADFLRTNLQNYRPEVSLIPARKRGTPFSPDEPGIVAPLLQSNAIFLGPGSPTYAVRQLQDSLLWQTLQARHRQGATLILASAATIAVGALALPVYEIYKVGEDLHWAPGLNLLAPFGLELVFVSHWDNNEGGTELDTRRCFMGQARFQQLLAMLPPAATVVGIDEHTALILDLAAATCHVMGRAGITLLRGAQGQRHTHGQAFAITELGPFRLPEPKEGILATVWERAEAAPARATAESAAQPPPGVLALLEERAAARAGRDWAAADRLRDCIAALGWQVRDTPAGQELSPR
jgi:cyanophycinase-like exopeptidase